MKRTTLSARALAACAVIALAACSGHSAALPVAGHQTTQGRTASVQFNIKVPTSTAAGARTRHYISGATTTAQIAIDPAVGSPVTTSISCYTGSCSGTVQAPIGVDSFGVALEDSNNNVLSAGQTTATIVQGQANTVNLAFQGVVKSIEITATQAITSGTPTTIAANVEARDADNFLIVGSQPYLTPIALMVNDPSNSLTLSTTQVTSPADVLEISYNGNAFSGATISASVPDSTVVITPLALNAIATGSITSLPGFKQVRLTDEYSNISIGTMTGGPDGRVWAFGNNQYGAHFYAVDPLSGATTVYAAPDGARMDQKSGMAPVGTNEIAAVDNIMGVVDLISTSGDLIKQYPLPVSGGPYLSPIAASDGNLYLQGTNLAELDLTTGTWSQYAISSSYFCGSGEDIPRAWTSGSNGNLYTACNGSLLMFDLASHTFSQLARTNSDGAIFEAGALGPSLVLGTDGYFYGGGEVYDPVQNVPVSPAIGYMAQSGGNANEVPLPANVMSPTALLQSAPGQLAYIAPVSGGSGDMITFVSESSHAFNSAFYVDPSAGLMTGVAQITNASGQPAGFAYAENSDTIGIYAPSF